MYFLRYWINNLILRSWNFFSFVLKVERFYTDFKYTQVVRYCIRRGADVSTWLLYGMREDRCVHLGTVQQGGGQMYPTRYCILVQQWGGGMCPTRYCIAMGRRDFTTSHIQCIVTNIFISQFQVQVQKFNFNKFKFKSSSSRLQVQDLCCFKFYTSVCSICRRAI